MAIIEESKVVSNDGIKKSIDSNSMGMALDILQRGLYAHPIESTVRELASNAYDAVIERDVARNIILGKTPVEDHFDVTKSDGIFHASGWEPDYFDLNWLSDDPDVGIFYEEGKLKDTLRIVDNGVGLGKDRMVGYFQLNYSSKRANKDSLGRFGLGSKVALSLGVDSFRVISRYNGRKFKFDVYLDKVDPIVSKFGNGKMNDHVELPTGRVIDNEDGTSTKQTLKAFYEETTEKNGLELIIEVKKHNKARFFEAVESQLMYMPRVRFHHKTENDIVHKEVNFKADILYRDKDIVVSESRVFNKPHILLGTGEALINYGFIAFNELEIEPKNGAVGLILDINDIEVTPSREAAIWSAKTRQAVLQKYEDVQNTAKKVVDDSLKGEDDYLSWLRKVNAVLGAANNRNDNSLLSKLASIIDVTQIKDLSFKGNKNLTYKTDFKKAIANFANCRVINYSQYSKKVSRDTTTEIGCLRNEVYFTRGNADALKDRYISEKGAFTLINLKVDDELIGSKFLNSILESPEAKDYDAIVVPEDVIESYMASDMDTDEIAEEVVVKYDRALLRKQQQKIVLHKARHDYPKWVLASSEHKISDIRFLSNTNELVYLRYGERDSVMGILNGACKGVFASNSSDLTLTSEFRKKYLSTDKFITIYATADENLKYLQGAEMFTHISDFVVDHLVQSEGKVVFSETIKYLATLSLINELIYKQFDTALSRVYCQTNFKHIDPELYKYCKALYDVNYSFHNSMIHSDFWKECISNAAMESGYLPKSDQAIDQNLEFINWCLPEAFLDRIGGMEIKAIDILNLDMLSEFMEAMSKYKNDEDLLWLFSDAHISDKSKKMAIANRIKSLLTNDEGIQQQDNTEN